MIELELFALKYEVNYKDKSYIIEAIDYFNGTDETKWFVVLNDQVLTTSYEFANKNSTNINNFAFNTKDKAVNALKVYLQIEDKLEEERAKYTEEIILLKNELKLPHLFNLNAANDIKGDFLSLDEIEIELNKIGCFKISKSNKSNGGVQMSVSSISNMLLLERTIEDIAKNNSCKVINIYNYDLPHFSYSKPLYYYWQSGNDFVRHFALLKELSQS